MYEFSFYNFYRHKASNDKEIQIVLDNIFQMLKFFIQNRTHDFNHHHKDNALKNSLNFEYDIENLEKSFCK